MILLPEIEFNYDSIVAKIRQREAQGKHFTIVIVAEGARLAGGDFVTAGAAGSNREARLGGIGHVVAGEIEARTGRNAAPSCWAICSGAAPPRRGIASSAPGSA